MPFQILILIARTQKKNSISKIVQFILVYEKKRRLIFLLNPLSKERASF